MRALADWYFTAHPPIMHDLHEAMPLLYTYSGGPPQNPNLDPILFTELPFFANFELAQMTKWGMPGVYTHAFMDGWSPGYLGSVAYNHNGMMRMYETQSGTEGPTAPVTTQGAPTEGGGGCEGCRGCQGCEGCGGCEGCRGCRGCEGCGGCRGCAGCGECRGGGLVRRSLGEGGRWTGAWGARWPDGIGGRRSARRAGRWTRTGGRSVNRTRWIAAP